ncbi:MAG: response regulator transcription factor [Bacteroidia bacterium]|nr:response regulator transcription factor [Bacteroidia bacterium]
MQVLRVAIFDDNRPLLDALQMLINGTPGYQVVGAYPDAGALLVRIAACRPDVVLMDIEMPGTDGIEAVRLLKTQFPQIQVLMQTVFEDEDRVFAALCAGAGGYLLKNTPPARLLEAIAEVAAGGAPMSPVVARKALEMFRRFAPQEVTVDYRLTPREGDVLSLLVQGLPYKLIADRLSITYETVRSHMKHIYEKLHVASTTEAVAKALREKLV